MAEKTKTKGVKKNISLMALLLIPVAVAINIVGGQIVAALKLPIYLDSVGTILIAILAGPWLGALTGLLSNSINAIFDPTFFPYVIVSIVLGLVAGFLASKKMFTKIWKVAVSGVILALCATIVSSPITAFFFGGVTGSGSTFITAALMATGQNLIQSVLTSSIIADLCDKVLSVFICFFIIKSISSRYLSKFSYGEFYIKKKAGKAEVTEQDKAAK
ncbi:MAG: ECF transporter S component [Clostridia bacterium]|nr:ECF transporter S component [Clostridia bacterium]